jgi:leucyl aminopeptidase
MKFTLQPAPTQEKHTIIPTLSNGDGPQEIQISDGISLSIDADIYKSAKDEIHVIQQEDQIFWLVGLGKDPGNREASNIIRKFIQGKAKKFHSGIQLNLNHCGEKTHENSFISAVLRGVQWGFFETKQFSPLWNVDYLPDFEVGCQLEGMDAETFETIASEAQYIVEAQMKASQIVNAPGNFKYPELWTDFFQSWLRLPGVDLHILNPHEIEKRKMDALMAVGRASQYPPHCIVATYTPRHYTRTIGLVGKGITFDTGGISIKNSSNLHFMKCDMGGAAAVAGAFEAIALSGLPVQVHLVIPIAENAIDGDAYKPGDVIGSHAGKSIEIIDTDAEGRLILADGLSYMNTQFNPDYILDLATLTGSIVTTLGYEAAGLFTQSAELVSLLNQAADSSGEKIWQLPLWDDYKEDLHSDVADIRNFSGKPVAGAITAAKFLEAFTNEHPAWAHLDIAGVAFKESEVGKMKNATGWGVHILYEFAKLVARDLN